MKVYAVIEKYADEYDSEDYDMVVDDHVYLKEEDAKKRLEELAKKSRWSEYKIRNFEVKE